MSHKLRGINLARFFLAFRAQWFVVCLEETYAYRCQQESIDINASASFSAILLCLLRTELRENNFIVFRTGMSQNE